MRAAGRKFLALLNLRLGRNSRKAACSRLFRLRRRRYILAPRKYILRRCWAPLFIGGRAAA